MGACAEVILYGDLISDALVCGSGSADIKPITITEPGIYTIEAEDCDGYAPINVNVMPAVSTMPLTAEAGQTYHASDYGVDGFDPVTAVEKTYNTIEEASDEYVHSKITTDNYYLDFYVENITDASAIMGYKTSVKAGFKDKTTGDWVNNKTSGMLYGQGAKNVTLTGWEIKNGVCYYDYTYIDYNGNFRTVSQNTPIRETELTNLKIEKVG